MSRSNYWRQYGRHLARLLLWGSSIIYLVLEREPFSKVDSQKKSYNSQILKSGLLLLNDPCKSTTR